MHKIHTEKIFKKRDKKEDLTKCKYFIVLERLTCVKMIILSKFIYRVSTIPTKDQQRFFWFLLFSFCFVFQTTLNECQVFRALTPFVNDTILAFSFPMIYFVFSGPYFFQFQRIEFQLLGLKNHSKIKRRKWFFFPCSYRGQQTASFIINTHLCRYYSNK